MADMTTSIPIEFLWRKSFGSSAGRSSYVLNFVSQFLEDFKWGILQSSILEGSGSFSSFLLFFSYLLCFSPLFLVYPILTIKLFYTSLEVLSENIFHNWFTCLGPTIPDYSKTNECWCYFLFRVCILLLIHYKTSYKKIPIQQHLAITRVANSYLQILISNNLTTFIPLFPFPIII